MFKSFYFCKQFENFLHFSILREKEVHKSMKLRTFHKQKKNIYYGLEKPKNLLILY